MVGVFANKYQLLLSWTWLLSFHPLDVKHKYQMEEFKAAQLEYERLSKENEPFEEAKQWQSCDCGAMVCPDCTMKSCDNDSDCGTYFFAKGTKAMIVPATSLGNCRLSCWGDNSSKRDTNHRGIPSTALDDTNHCGIPSTNANTIFSRSYWHWLGEIFAS